MMLQASGAGARAFFVLALTLFNLLAGLLFSSAALAKDASVLFITTSPVAPAKFRLLAEIAQPQGIEVEVRYVEKLPREIDAQLFAGYQLVVFDAPRDHLRDMVRGRLAAVLPGLRVPSLWIHDTQPSWRGLPDALAQRLHSYYLNGSRRNFEGFFATLAAHFAGRPLTGIAEPIVFPKSAVYHPEAPELVFADARAYLTWQERRGQGSGKGAPVIAITMYQAAIANEQTAFIDDLIARIEAGGARALAFYGSLMDADDMSKVLAPDGARLADVIINTQIMLNPDGRRKEFETLGMPVIQAMVYRQGDEAAWAADPQGVPLMDVPFFMAQSEYARHHRHPGGGGGASE